MPCDAQSLVTEAQCLEECLPEGFNGPIIIALLCRIANMTCDFQSLVGLGASLQDLPPGLQGPIMVALLCQIQINGSTGGGGGSGGNPAPGVVNPNGNVTGAPGANYYNSANATVWVQASAVTSNTGWVQTN